MSYSLNLLFFFFNDTATTEIYTLSLHDALPISPISACGIVTDIPTKCHAGKFVTLGGSLPSGWIRQAKRSEEHTSELQSRLHLVCRLLLEKKKNNLS